jgi:hypothetical protein
VLVATSLFPPLLQGAAKEEELGEASSPTTREGVFFLLILFLSFVFSFVCFLLLNSFLS